AVLLLLGDGWWGKLRLASAEREGFGEVGSGDQLHPDQVGGQATDLEPGRGRPQHHAGRRPPDRLGPSEGPAGLVHGTNRSFPGKSANVFATAILAHGRPTRNEKRRAAGAAFWRPRDRPEWASRCGGVHRGTSPHPGLNAPPGGGGVRP